MPAKFELDEAVRIIETGEEGRIGRIYTDGSYAVVLDEPEDEDDDAYEWVDEDDLESVWYED